MEMLKIVFRLFLECKNLTICVLFPIPSAVVFLCIVFCDLFLFLFFSCCLLSVSLS